MVLLLRQRTFLSLLLVIILRNAGISSLSIWVLLYLRNPIEEGGLGMSIQKAAMHLSFLSVPGVVSAPVLGYLSDRFGRKVVAVPSLVFTALLVGVMGLVGAGLLLTLLTLAVGLFPLGVMHILQATVLDHVDRGDEGASMGLITLCSAVVTVLATVLFGFILDAFGLGVVFYYSAGLVGTAAVLLLFTALRPLAAAPQPGLTVG
jgi:MFS family permease